MLARPTFPRPARRRRRPGERLSVEALEPRSLPSVTSWVGTFTWAGSPGSRAAPVAADTLDAALALGSISPSGAGAARPNQPGQYAEALGTLGPAGTADVDWVRFTLTSPAEVTVLTTRGAAQGELVPVISLYDDAPLNPGDSTQNDPYTPVGHRLLGQDDGAAHGGAASLDWVLGTGTYWVAVSGTGNHYFHPFLANSGTPGGTGNYGLVIAAHALPHLPGAGPAVIAATPADGAGLGSSPSAIRLTLDSPLDPNTIVPMANVVLLNGNGNPVQLQQNDGWSFFDPTHGTVFDAAANELAVFPEAPLAPGDYTLVLYGTPGQLDVNGNPVDAVRGINGEALGSTDPGGPGQDYRLTFHVTGVEGTPGTPPVANDTIGTAHDLGDVSSGGPVQVPGTIGDDPFAPGAANDVDLYHFRVTGPGHYALVAGADAGRIGSPLDPALALFQVVNGQVTLVGADNDTGNQTKATDGSTPLTHDAALYAGLTAGDYYLAVGGAFNLPDPALGIPYPTPGFYDPTQSYSAQSGFSTGDYVLNLSLHRDDAAPHVTAVDGLPSSTPGMPPTFITVHFDKPVNLRQLGYQQDLPANPGAVSAVWVHGSDGVDYHPRLLSYDDAHNVATFYLLDAVPNGPSALHLAGILADGSAGLTDLAGNLLAGSDANGDYVVPFTVNGPRRVIDPKTGRLTWTSQEPNNSPDSAQLIGPLFPDELGGSKGVDLLGRLTRGGSGAAADTVDYYQIEVLQSRSYGFSLSDQVRPAPGHPALPLGATVRVFTTDGHEILRHGGTPSAFALPLDAGTYIVEVGPLGSSRTSDLNYRLHVTLADSLENAVALTTGAAPPYAISLQRGGTPAPPPSPSPPSPTPVPPPLVLPPAPGTDGGVVPATTVTTSSSPGGAPSQLSLPAGALTEFSASPVGGVRGADVAQAPQAPAAAPQLTLPGLPAAAPPNAGGVAGVSLTTDSAGGEGDSPGDAGPGNVIDQVLRALHGVGGAAVDRLFHGGAAGGWLSQYLRGLAIPLALPPAATPAAESGPAAEPDEGAADDATGAPPESVSAPSGAASEPRRAADWLWASGLLVTAGAAAGLVAVGWRPDRAGELSERQPRRLGSVGRGPDGVS